MGAQVRSRESESRARCVDPVEVRQLIPACYITAGQVDCSQQAKTTLRPLGNVPVFQTGRPPVMGIFRQTSH